ncbi:hypothetical protein GCM10028792_21750 [Salinisphaera aquimarina]
MVAKRGEQLLGDAMACSVTHDRIDAAVRADRGLTNPIRVFVPPFIKRFGAELLAAMEAAELDAVEDQLAMI